MRVALISDVHANLPALQAVLRHALQHRVQAFWGAGDWVGLGAFPNEVLDCLRLGNVAAVYGNYDLKVRQVPGIKAKWRSEKPPSKWRPHLWAHEQLSDENRTYLRSLPEEIRLLIEGRRILLRHQLAAEAESSAADAPREGLHPEAEAADADIVIVGHTHVPVARKIRSVWFINPGSVGRPDDGDPRASYAILSIGRSRVQVRHYRVEYDVQAASEALRQRQVPAPREAAPKRALDPRPQRGKAHRDPVWPASAEALSDERLAAVLHLAESCHYEENHTHQVTRLALQLFDELKPVHGLGPQARFWLQCAALLHDVGLIDGVTGHHKASLRIILNAPQLPFDKTERLIIGSIARYHRAALPAERHAHFAKLKPEARHVVLSLAAILRVADGLDYTHQSVVSELSCAVSPQRIIVRCITDRPAEVERQRAVFKGDLLEQVFRRKLEIE